MKKIILLTIVLLSLVPLASAEVTLTSNLLKYEPIPAQPGQYVTVFVELKNMGNDDANNVAIELKNQFPFSVADDTRKEIGTLKAQQSYVVDFKIKVDSQAVVGANDLVIRYTNDPSLKSWQEDYHPINVRPTESSIAVVNVKVTPEEIIPGQEGTVQITVKNTADIMLRDISLQLGLMSVVGTTAIDLPFIPTNSVTEKKITRLAPNNQAIVTYNIKAYPTAAPGYYKLPLTVSFYDEEGTKTDKTDYLGVIVEATPELKIYVEDTKNLQKEEKGTVTLKFVNKGISDLKFLDVEVLPSKDYDLTDKTQTYVGDIDSDDYRSETFTLTPHKETIQLNVKVNYKNSNNKVYETTRTVSVNMNTANNEKKKISTASVVIALLVLLGIIFFFRRHKRRQEKRK